MIFGCWSDQDPNNGLLITWFTYILTAIFAVPHTVCWLINVPAIQWALWITISWLHAVLSGAVIANYIPNVWKKSKIVFIFECQKISYNTLFNSIISYFWLKKQFTKGILWIISLRKTIIPTWYLGQRRQHHKWFYGKSWILARSKSAIQ